MSNSEQSNQRQRSGQSGKLTVAATVLGMVAAVASVLGFLFSNDILPKPWARGLEQPTVIMVLDKAKAAPFHDIYGKEYLLTDDPQATYTNGDGSFLFTRQPCRSSFFDRFRPS